MHIKTCSPEYKFKSFKEGCWCGTVMLCNRKFSEDQPKLSYVEASAENNVEKDEYL